MVGSFNRRVECVPEIHDAISCCETNSPLSWASELKMAISTCSTLILVELLFKLLNPLGERPGPERIQHDNDCYYREHVALKVWVRRAEIE